MEGEDRGRLALPDYVVSLAVVKQFYGLEPSWIGHDHVDEAESKEEHDQRTHGYL